MSLNVNSTHQINTYTHCHKKGVIAKATSTSTSLLFDAPIPEPTNKFYIEIDDIIHVLSEKCCIISINKRANEKK